MAIRHTDSCTDDISKLLNNDVFSDVVLVVGPKRYYVQKAILAIRSEYFSSLFSSGLSESTQREVEIKEINAALFEKLLGYIYTGKVDLDQAETETADLLIMADKYLFKDLGSDIASHLGKNLTPQNFSTVYSAASLRSIQSLKDECLQFVDSKCNEVLNSAEFANLDVDAVGEFVSRPTFKPDQTNLFTAISKWIEINGREHAGPILSQIRLSDLPLEFLVKTVRASGLFSESDILDAISAMENLSGFNQNTMLISVQTTCLKSFNNRNPMPFMVMSNDTVAVVKQKIRVSRTCCPITDGDHLRLFHNGVHLEDDLILKDSDIQSGSSVTLYHMN